MVICEKKDCTGCAACKNICPFDAIMMIEDKYGFIYPTIDIAKCKGCELCKKVCPNNKPVNGSQPSMVLAAYAKDKNIHASSTSGGLATAISYFWIKQGGVLYSHMFQENMCLNCVKITDMKDLYKTQGSKYIQSNMGDVYRQIGRDLSNGEKVLFIGTPCQVAGVLNYTATTNIEKRSDFITMSFICGGVPSQKMLRDCIGERDYRMLSDVKFRNNDEYSLRLFKNGTLIKDIQRIKSKFFIGFDEHIIQRESCYHCKYAKPVRIGDITIGDFWGMKKTQIDPPKVALGVSLLLATSQKGSELVCKCIEDQIITAEEHQLDEMFEQNPRMLTPVEKKKEVTEFRKYYPSSDYNRAIDRIYRYKYILYRIKAKIKKVELLDRIYHKYIRKGE